MTGISTGALIAPLAFLGPEYDAEIRRMYTAVRREDLFTTDLDGHRQVVWDLGAIASRGGPRDLDLIRRVVLASASIPGFFPPVKIPV